MTTGTLSIELVPRTAHGINLRAAAKRSQWDRIKELTVQLAGGRCEVCSAPRTEKHSLEAHEVWSWDESTCRQTLVRTTALCYWCHLAKHPGLADKIGQAERMHKHVMRVNSWSAAELVSHTKASLREWLQLSTIQWTFEPDLAAIIAELETRATEA